MSRNKLARKKSRILKSADYQACYSLGKRFHTRHFAINLLYIPDTPGRFGMTVSRKAGNAVKRNRIKRLLREFFHPRINKLPCCQVVITVKQDAPDFNLGMLEKELIPVFQPYLIDTKSHEL